MTPSVRAIRISRSLHDLEDQIDRLIGKVGSLTFDITEARIEFDIDAYHGQRPLQRLIEVQAKLAEARSKATGAHSDLKKISETRADIPIGCPDKEIGFLSEAKVA